MSRDAVSTFLDYSSPFTYIVADLSVHLIWIVFHSALIYFVLLKVIKLVAD